MKVVNATENAETPKPNPVFISAKMKIKLKKPKMIM